MHANEEHANRKQRISKRGHACHQRVLNQIQNCCARMSAVRACRRACQSKDHTRANSNQRKWSHLLWRRHPRACRAMLPCAERSFNLFKGRPRRNWVRCEGRT